MLRVEEPTALRRLRAPSVMGQCESSRRVSRGMCLIISLSVASVTSKPHSHKHCTFFSWERLSLPADTYVQVSTYKQSRENILEVNRCQNEKVCA